ncbi:UDP-N-acetylmuramoyl-L-alanyl-D-glutamate--2,6-diaminopimelate ligase [Aminicella lysinilytica]|uniref:UDP-N-acetylmuramyl-tripeptide synthetase n=1 Tax=Aminicella lysinilytica TaxID=433323 RepID=A0A4R6QBF8_9FIRM|nr:UDP-N-acetylmuramoyl-L-alanyl-D-glutamate--2,6-diaminopimelate ligase [Aminicella lysinilytica]NLD10243.1 UDP-N-acetylmuramoyl-L-alanyl-D-glutamate--2,6-diaminopimelate ligase [Clostridiales bacterium]TDP59143.1 UDP-N-acetylmuramoylalanyl-D-glutamate--2,6-diaminopimelate ligase [Aminicella lysinilytica]
MKLSTLFSNQPDIEITGLAMDSRRVKTGNVFFCIEGLEADGHDFAGKAVEAGAVAIVHSKDIPEQKGIVYIKSNHVGDELNRACDIFNGRPSSSLTVFGVTGTNGKSTTSSIISDIYSAKEPCGYMGTIAVRYGSYSRVPTLTTPDQIEVHADLAEMVDHGMKAAAMEVSSHGLAMGRVDTVDFDCAIFTNLTYDHLDYHKTMENYFEAKKILFKNIKKDGVAVLNADDEASIDGLKACCNCRYVTYGTGVLGKADYQAEDISLSTKGTTFVLNCKGERYPVSTNLVALYNIYNLLAAIGAMHECGMPIEQMLPLIEDIPQVDGRMEIIDEGQDFNVIVDYAHTPDGFDKVFEYADEITKNGGGIIAVFGSAGKRDKVKRKILGQIAGRHCRTVVVTEEDPRNEKAEDIGAEIMSGVKESGCKGIFVPDRIEAIDKAMSLARKGDLVLILGKGDESYMYYEDGRAPFIGDNEAAKRAIKKLV